jgi:hypothetical protein
MAAGVVAHPERVSFLRTARRLASGSVEVTRDQRIVLRLSG